MCGGHSEVKVASDKVKEIALSKQSEVEGQLNKTFDTFEAVSYTSQVVCGTNARIKVHVGNESYIHLKIFIALECYGGNIELQGVEEGKTLTDAL
jgi:cystatin-A/B